MIDRQTIERIKDRADILDVVSEFVSLKKVGANYRGLCPFHDDHSPSFYVSPSRGTCHCFVCGEGGDSTGFIMKHESLSYPDALRWLANRYGIQVEETQMNEKQKKEQSEREAMFIINDWASKYFNDILNNDIDGRAIGMQYFRQRGIRDDIIEKFRLGFCLNDRRNLSNEAKKKGYNTELLIKTGLCYQNDNGELIDRFAGRVMFPWMGVSGKVTAFGGRVLDSRTKGVNQKYVNSPDSIIYHKDHELYGIFQAKKAIGRENCVYMVEGYTDVISMHQCGIENVVANSGTALSEHQVRMLHRFTPNIVMLYDGDKAGVKAALRGTDMFLKDGMNVKVLLFPDGDDPDSFAKKHTADEFRAYIKEHQTDFIEFKTQVLLKEARDPHERAAAVSSIVKSISVIGDPIIRASYIQDCSMRLGYSEQALTAKMNEEIRNYREEKLKEEQRQSHMETQQILRGEDPANQQSTTNAPVRNDTTGNAARNNTMGNAAGTPATDNSGKKHTQRKEESIADIIIKEVIMHGDKILYKDIEDGEGNTISLTVAQFIKYDLDNDRLIFANPLYNRILNEAAEHSIDPDFNSEKYFTLHHDYEISSLSINMSADSFIVSKQLQVERTIEGYREVIDHMLAEFRNEYIKQRINTLTMEINMAGNDPERQIKLITELQEAQKLRAMIAKKIGSNIVR